MRMWIRSGWVAIAGLLLIVASAEAADKRIVNLNLFTQNDLRALAMGNAFSPVARGETALYYNPAGLAQFDLDLKAEYSANIVGSEKFGLDTYETSSSNPTDQELVDYLERYAGTTQRFNYGSLGSGVANVGYSNFGAGYGSLDYHRASLVFDDANTPGSILDDTLTIADSRLRMQSAAVGFKLGKGKVLLGLTAKSLKYSEGAKVIPYTTIITSGELDVEIPTTNFDSATAYDVGMLYRMEFWSALKPQMSLTAYNVGGIELKGPTETVVVPASYNIGFSFGPDTGFVHWLVSMEVEDVSDALKVTDFGTGINANLPCNDPLRTETCVNQPRGLLQRTHVGAEIGLWRTPTGNNILSLRAGNNRGYTTYGWELNLWVLRILYAKGADNLGWQDNVDKFDFTGYQVGIAVAW